MTKDNNSSSSSQIENKLRKKMEWKQEEEKILKEWADKALCFRWLHSKAQQRYVKFYAALTIPVIILSTITGTANFAQERVPDDYKSIFVMVIGSLNIVAGIITTISQFLKVAELNEGHRVASISWGKFGRQIKVQLARHPSVRTPVYDMMKRTQDEYDRLTETSPAIPQKVINDFMKMVIQKKLKAQDEGNRQNKRMKRMDKLDFALPEICGEIKGIEVYDPEEAGDNYMDDIMEVPADIKQQQLQEIQKIEEFKTKFQQIHGRNPTEEELKENVELSLSENNNDISNDVNNREENSNIDKNIGVNSNGIEAI